MSYVIHNIWYINIGLISSKEYQYKSFFSFTCSIKTTTIECVIYQLMAPQLGKQYPSRMDSVEETYPAMNSLSKLTHKFWSRSENNILPHRVFSEERSLQVYNFFFIMHNQIQDPSDYIIVSSIVSPCCANKPFHLKTPTNNCIETLIRGLELLTGSTPLLHQNGHMFRMTP